MRVEMVRYYYMPPGAVVDRNTGIAVVFGPWPQGALRSRGWTPERMVTQRVATEQEHTWLHSCLRHQAYLYPDLDGLLADEAQVVDPEVLARLSCDLRERVNLQ